MAELRITSDLPIYDKLMEDCFFLLMDGKLRTQPEIIKYLKPFSPPEPVAPPPAAKKSKGIKKPVPAVAKKTEPAKADAKTAAPKTDTKPIAPSAKGEVKPAAAKAVPVIEHSAKPAQSAKTPPKAKTLKPVKTGEEACSESKETCEVCQEVIQANEKIQTGKEVSRQEADQEKIETLNIQG